MGLALAAAALLGACAGPAKQRPAAPQAYEQGLEAVQALMSERRYADAVARLERLARRRPDAAAPHYLRGQCLYRMHRFDAAVTAFDDALAREPRHFGATARRWAALRAAAPDDAALAARIAAEIEALLAAAPDAPEALFAAYQGYDYIGERRRQRETLRRLAGSVGDHPLAATVSTLLAEELNLERDPAARVRLATGFLEAFPGAPREGDVTRALVTALAREHASPDAFVAAIDGYLERFPDNRHLRLRLAAACLAGQRCVARAGELLEGYWRLAARGPAPAPAATPAADTAVHERAEAELLHGLALAAAGVRSEAAAHWRRVPAATPSFARAQHELGELAADAGDVAAAVAHLRAALESARAGPDTEARLAALLAGRAGFAGDPAAYFAAREGVVRFTDVSAAAGLEGLAARKVAWGDYDDDGFEDLLLDGPRLLRNDGAGAFVDVTAAAGLDGLSGYRGGLWADADNDARLDVLLFGPAGVRLLRNDGAGGFVDVTATAFAQPPPGAVEAAAWGDADNDGLLDLYLARYELRGPERALCAADRLLGNRGDGTFVDVTHSAGLVSDEPMCARGVTWTDLNADGRQDIVVANYRLDPNFLWLNRGGGRFRERGAALGVRGRNNGGFYGHSLGSVAGDLDGDGDTDLFVANLAHPRFIDISDVSMLLVNEGAPHYRLHDRFAASGIGFEETSADAALADVDNDGDLDLYVTSVYAGRDAHLYLNDGRGGFRDVTWFAGARVDDAWGAAFADHDNDGDLDLLVAGASGARLLRNEARGRHWLEVRVRSRRCNRFGVGATLTLSHGERRSVRAVSAGKGFGTQDSLRVHFGLDDHAGPVRLVLRDACGRRSRHRLEQTDRIVTLDR